MGQKQGGGSAKSDSIPRCDHFSPLGMKIASVARRERVMAGQGGASAEKGMI
jgi:hypothetical protein